MDKIVIEGGARLRGSVQVSGAKNAALPILAASILSGAPCTFRNVPGLHDIDSMLALLAELGGEVERPRARGGRVGPPVARPRQ
jgi:UDP-N-acetylglucosamine 1-carboxyvinyltransferase